MKSLRCNKALPCAASLPHMIGLDAADVAGTLIRRAFAGAGMEFTAVVAAVLLRLVDTFWIRGSDMVM
jgi:hypothetical protein